MIVKIFQESESYKMYEKMKKVKVETLQESESYNKIKVKVN